MEKTQEAIKAEEMLHFTLNLPQTEPLRQYWSKRVVLSEKRELMKELFYWTNYVDRLPPAEQDILGAYIVGKFGLPIPKSSNH